MKRAFIHFGLAFILTIILIFYLLYTFVWSVPSRRSTYLGNYSEPFPDHVAIDLKNEEFFETDQSASNSHTDPCPPKYSLSIDGTLCFLKGQWWLDGKLVPLTGSVFFILFYMV